MEEEFRTLLLSESGVTDRVGSRVNWGEHPQGAPLPAIVLSVVSEVDGLHMQGPDRFAESRVQVDCYAMTYAEKKQLSRAVMAVLHGYRGGGFRLVRHAGTRDSREGGTNEATRPYRASLDFTCHWRA
jgi:hypothetical protein